MRFIKPLALALLAGACAAQTAPPPPPHIRDTYPPQAVASTWADILALTGKQAVLDHKTRNLIGLAVAAAVPCQYCVYLHAQAARASGATEAEIKEAVAAAAETRKMSTVLYGNAYDPAAFRAEVDAIFGRK